MARPPSGPIGNSPRDVRDDAVGVPAEPVTAPEPPRWPPKRKKITSNTFHAKVSGGSSPSRADRKPTFRRGGMVKGYASGGSVASKIEKRDKLPGEDKNDPFAKQNLKKEQSLKGGGGVKKKARGGLVGPEGPYTAGGKTVKGLSHFHPAHDFDPGTGMGSIGPKHDEAQTDEVGAERRMRDMRSGRDLRDNDWSPKEPGYPKREDRQFKAGGGVRKMQLGGPLTPGYAGRKSFYPFNKGPEEEVKSGAMRSESTENARALDRAGKRMDTRVPGSPTQQEIKDTAEDARTFKQTGDYKRGGGVKKADGGMIDPMNPNDPSNAPAGSGTLLPGLKLRPRGPVDPSRRDPEGYLRPDVDPLDDGPISRPIRNPQPGFKKGGKV